MYFPLEGVATSSPPAFIAVPLDPCAWCVCVCVCFHIYLYIGTLRTEIHLGIWELQKPDQAFLEHIGDFI